MILALLAVAGLAWWLHRDGLLLPNLRRLGVAAGAGLIAARLLETGQVIGGLIVAAAGLAWWQWPARRAPPTHEVASARAILSLSPSADHDEVRAAWRRAMAVAHPDRGGSSDRAAQITAARDVLLRH